MQQVEGKKLKQVSIKNGDVFIKMKYIAIFYAVFQQHINEILLAV
jgi:hypothetical protein